MFTELINSISYMSNRVINNLDIFISSMIFIVVFGYIVYFIVIKVHKLITKSEISGAKLDILLVPFIILFMLVAVAIGVSGWNNETITEANILVAVVSFLSPFIAFVGAYALAEENHKKSENIRKTQEDIENNKKLEYKKLMLFNLLDYTIHKTENLYAELNKCYKGAYSGELKDNLPPVKGYENEVIGELENDVPRIHTLISNQKVKGFANSLKVLFNDTFLRDVHLNEFVYDKNWTSYLDCIPKLRDEHKVRDIQRITNWLMVLQEYKSEGYNRKQIDPIDFVLMRRGIKGLIDELAPDIKENGFRNKIS